MLPREAPQRRRPAEPAARTLIRAALLVSIAAVALSTAACGDEDEPAPAADASTELAITLDRDGSDGPKEIESVDVACPGDEPAICDAAAALPAGPAEPTPPDVACTEIYGGPDVVTVKGTLDGEPIDAELTRANGCEIDRFDRFTPMLTELFPGYEPGAELGA